MIVLETPISGVRVVEIKAFEDHRGAFARLFCSAALQGAIGERQIVQINHSRTRAVGAIRGMHYQKAPRAEMKIIRCLRGRVYDVAVDLRRDSPTFLRWTALELDPVSRRALLVPEGCAHGFQVLEPDSELLYLHTAPYSPGFEGALRYDDPAIGIRWPLAAIDLSHRDQQHPWLDANFSGLET